MYENLHTKEVCSIGSVETVSSPPIRVYVLSNGSRWNDVLFREHWRKLTTACTGLAPTAHDESEGSAGASQ